MSLWLPNNVEVPQRPGPQKPVAIFIPLDAVFPGEVASVAGLRELLANVSRTDALFWCARLNLILSNPSNFDHIGKQEYCINALFGESEITRINQFLANREDPKRVFIFCRPQLLDLMLWVARYSTDLPNDGKTFSSSEVRLNFAKAALISSELWGQRLYPAGDEISTRLDVAKGQMMGAFRNAASQVSSGMVPMFAIGRGQRMFSTHIPKHFPKFEELFQAETELPLLDYFALMMIATRHADCTPKKASGDQPRIGIMAPLSDEERALPVGELFERYCSIAAVAPEELTTQIWQDDATPATHDPRDLTWDRFKILRQRPLLRTTDGRAIILDPVFMAESASAGPLFRVLSGDQAQNRKVFAAFGKAFEEYAHAILRLMYPKSKGGLANVLTCPEMGTSSSGQVVEIADACLNFVTDIVLIEAKAKWLKDGAGSTKDPNDYIEELRSKYVQSKSGERQAVGQMANVVNCLVAGTYIPAEQDFGSAQRLFPVLLAHDSYLDAPLHPQFLAGEFQRELAPDSVGEIYMRKGEFDVAPLTVITIGDLEILERSVEKFSFRDALADYAKLDPGRTSSFHNFLTLPPYSDKLIAPSYYAFGGIEVMNRVKELTGRDDVSKAIASANGTS